jgi:eukaryotic-like serine/threonine-protein kinase
MSLPIGTRLGHYEITARLGEGGMGEVFKARDTRLGREVALKTLPASFTHDAERLARFRREAQLLASLNHPHIAGIHGIEEIDGHQLLVLELVDGETLAARLARGPLDLEEARAMAREIAMALEAAHERGIVHRDLKPGNIALTADGTVKVLDFGLAKPIGDRSGGHPADTVNSPTITSPLTLTALGVILGTAAYMSPEQARGVVADRRSDVWAFGCVLYEMLTGTRAFAGDDATDTLAAVVRGQPDWDLLPATLPPAIRALLEGCLEKDRRRRIGDISVARFVLERAAALDGPAPTRQTRHPAWRWTPVVLAAAAVGIAAVAFLMRDTPPAAPVTRFTIQTAQGEELGLTRRALTISPDGRRIVYVAGGRLLMRPTAEFDPQPILGSDSGLQPVFSPDGQSLAFWADGAVKRMSVAGGVPVSLCSVSLAPFGLDWGEGGIVFVDPPAGIMRIPPGGGTPATLVAFEEVDGLMQGPQLLPDGDTLLFTVARSGQSNIWDGGQIVTQSLRTGDRKVLIEGGSNAKYVRTGHLVYMVEGTLMAVPFDLARGAVTGGPVPVVEGVRRTAPAAGGEGQFAVSATGTLTYIPGPSRTGNETIFLYGTDGSAQPLKLQPGTYNHPRVSPDSQWVAFESHDGKQWMIAVYHVSGATAARRLTFGGNNRFPVWAPDSRRVVFQSDRDGDHGLFLQPLNGGPADRLTKADVGTTHLPEAFSQRTDVLLYSVAREGTHTLWMLSMKDRQARPFSDVTSFSFPTNAVVSPDGRLVAYQAGDGRAGEATTYVEPFPPTGTKYEIARGGRPLWSPDGSRLFFIPGPGRFMATTVIASNDTLAFTSPEPVPRPFGLAAPGDPRTFDFLADGRLVGINTPGESGSAAANQIHVVQNWFEELKARAPLR